MKNKYVFTAVLLAMLSLVCFLLAGVGAGANRKEEGTFRIVTSFYPVYILTANITDQVPDVEIVNLTESVSGCLHDYQMRPEDLVVLSDADAFVINGGGMEAFISDVFREYPDLPVIEASEGIEYLAEDEDEINAHVWMDPDRYLEEIENVAEGLSRLDPSNASRYRENADAYAKRIEDLKKEGEVLRDAYAGAKTIAFHDAFCYLADYLEMDVAATIEMDENTSLSAGMLSEIVDEVKTGGIPVIFTEKQFGTQLADAVSKETGAVVCVIDSLVSGDYDKDSYITGMRENYRIISEGLR